MRTCYIKNDDNKHFHPGKKSFLHAKGMCRKEKKLSQNPQHHFQVVWFFFPPKKNSGCHRATSGIKAESFVRCSSRLMNTCGLQQLLSHAGGKQAAFYQLTAQAHKPQAQRMRQTTTMKISSPNAPCQFSPSASHPDSVAGKLLVLPH